MGKSSDYTCTTRYSLSYLYLTLEIFVSHTHKIILLYFTSEPANNKWRTADSCPYFPDR